MAVEIEIVRVPVAPGKMNDMLALLGAAMAPGGYLSRPACLGADVTTNGDTVIAMARWASRAVHEEAAKTAVAQTFFGALSALAGGPPSMESLQPSQSSGRLAGLAALVTGGASGIGRAVVDAFVREGARVGVADINEARLKEVSAAHGDRVRCIAGDLSTLAANKRAVAETVAAFGRLDTFVGNAGVFDGFADFAATSSDTLESGFDAVFGANVKALILGAREALPHLVRARGSIIVTLSNASLYPDGGGIMYVASKHAGLGVVRQLAHELAPAVRVNAVAPGATRTPIGVPPMFGPQLDQTTPEMAAMIGKVVPVGFQSDPADHAEAYVLLAAAAESRVMTGTVIETDGGLGVRGLRRTRGGDALLAE